MYQVLRFITIVITKYREKMEDNLHREGTNSSTHWSLKSMFNYDLPRHAKKLT